MIKILKASAGSGKTFALAQEYLSLLTERFAYRHILAVTFTNKATAEMKSRIIRFLAESGDAKKQEALRDILHDYSAFSVSTIDKFFQQALKAFAREIGQVADYQIDLDKSALIHEAMDRILDSITRDNTDLLEWLQRSVSEDIRQGRKVNPEKTLYSIGEQLMMEDDGGASDLKERFDKKKLEALFDNCGDIIDSFASRVAAAAKELEVTRTNSIKQLAPFLEEATYREKLKLPGATLMKEAEGSRFCDLFTGEEYRWYRTAWLLRDMAFSLGLAGEFFRSFEELLREKNVMVLDRSNTILRDIIAGSDAPFVYEKMGVRYESFLLDEFQDTSNIQWENFRPLLRESEANNHQSLIVGDVKQSIYRFRDSDWTLLAEKVGQDFPSASIKSKQENWRSLRTIVDFNNRFFKFASSLTGYAELYSDVEQEVRSKDGQKGFVRVSFCDKEDRDSLVLESIEAAMAAGAGYGDIGILVRTNAEGSAVASCLMDAGIPVVSDESLLLKSSLFIRKLTGILFNHENPDDLINKYIAEAESVEFPSEYHSLTDLCEAILRQLERNSPEEFKGETLYIQAFMDDLREWTEANGNELRAYLRHWNESSLSISSPSGTAAVRIITVHKSKGLEFPYVILPCLSSIGFYKASLKWCPLETEGTPFIPEAAGRYPVNLTKEAADTLFAPSLEEERKMQLVDNLNICYVAFTRAEKCLHIIANIPPKVFRESANPEYKDFSQILYKFCNCMEDSTFGEMYDFSRMDRGSDGGKENDFPYSYQSIPVGDRLATSADASDFFGEDGQTGPSASPRRNGIVLHGILSAVQKAEDLRKAVDGAILDGQLTPEEGEEAFRLLSGRIAAHGEWFESGAMNEVPMFDANGQEKRPDRVIIYPDGRVLVIDYKFGESTEENDRRYSAQVRGYMKIFRSLGYRDVSGLVWYVINDKLISL